MHYVRFGPLLNIVWDGRPFRVRTGLGNRRSSRSRVFVIPPQCIMLGSFFPCALLGLVFRVGVVPVLSIIINVLTDYDCRVRTTEPTVRVVPPQCIM